MGCETNYIARDFFFFFFLLGCLLPDVDRVWEKVGSMELEREGLLATEQPPLPNFLFPRLTSNGGGSLGELCCLNA